MTKPKLRERRVTELARWLHEAAARAAGASGGYVEWTNVSAAGKDRYARMAENLLDDPPDCLLDGLADQVE